MKHKLLTAIVATASALCLCFGLAACGENGGTNGNVEGGNGAGENNVGGNNTSTEHEHIYTAENKCSVCGDEWEYTEGLEYELKGDVYAVKGIGTASGDIVLPYGYQGKFVTEIADNAFKGSEAVTDIYIPEKIARIGKAAFVECTNLEHATWDAENCTKAGITYEEMSEMSEQQTNPNEVLIFWGAGLKSLTIGEHVKTIPDFAFGYCTALKGELVIPDSVTKIGSAAFGSSGYSTVTIGDNVTEIGEGAFISCEALESVTIPSSVTFIGDYAFCNCSALKSINIPDHVTSIGVQVFAGCNTLTSITIPNSVTSIGDSVFIGCSNLTDIYYNGTVEEWQAIEKSNSWNYSAGYYTITCTNGTIAKNGTVTPA